MTELTGDGPPDILWHHQETGQLWRVRAIAAFDQNHVVDLLWQNRQIAPR